MLIRWDVGQLIQELLTALCGEDSLFYQSLDGRDVDIAESQSILPTLVLERGPFCRLGARLRNLLV
jgi:hypothetical protein